MAIWQVSIVLIKTEKSFSGMENNQWNSLDELIAYFPEEKSWCSSTRQFGKLDSTCLEIDLETEEILLRIDLKSITRDQLETIIRFTDSNELKIKYKNKIENPTFDIFISILKESAAYRFINDPEIFLTNYGQSGDG